MIQSHRRHYLVMPVQRGGMTLKTESQISWQVTKENVPQKWEPKEPSRAPATPRPSPPPSPHLAEVSPIHPPLQVLTEQEPQREGSRVQRTSPTAESGGGEWGWAGSGRQHRGSGFLLKPNYMDSIPFLQTSVTRTKSPFLSLLPNTFLTSKWFYKEESKERMVIHLTKE